MGRVSGNTIPTDLLLIALHASRMDDPELDEEGRVEVVSTIMDMGDLIVQAIDKRIEDRIKQAFEEAEVIENKLWMGT